MCHNPNQFPVDSGCQESVKSHKYDPSIKRKIGSSKSLVEQIASASHRPPGGWFVKGLGAVLTRPQAIENNFPGIWVYKFLPLLNASTGNVGRR